MFGGEELSRFRGEHAPLRRDGKEILAELPSVSVKLLVRFRGGSHARTSQL